MAEAEVLKTAREYAAAVRKMMGTREIFLYGSHVRETATKDSDIDIAVVVDRASGDYLETLAALWRLADEINDEIEPVLLLSTGDTGGFLDTVQRTGISV
jgi:predicted nucleotidyltransferase